MRPARALAALLLLTSIAGTQMAVEPSSRLHVVGSAGGTHGHNKLGLPTGRTNVWQYDAGAEDNLLRPLTLARTWRPFGGVGAGGRSHDYRSADVKTRHCTTGYGSLGSESEPHAQRPRPDLRRRVPHPVITVSTPACPLRDGRLRPAGMRSSVGASVRRDTQAEVLAPRDLEPLAGEVAPAVRMHEDLDRLVGEHDRGRER